MSDNKTLEKFKDQYEFVEWPYDSVNGSVVAWARAHGSTYGNTMADHASDLTWVLTSRGEVVTGPDRLRSGPDLETYLKSGKIKADKLVQYFYLDASLYPDLGDVVEAFQDEAKAKRAFSMLDRILSDEDAPEPTKTQAQTLHTEIKSQVEAKYQGLLAQVEINPQDGLKALKDFINLIKGTSCIDGHEEKFDEIKSSDDYKLAVKISKELEKCKRNLSGKDISQRLREKTLRKLQGLIDVNPELAMSQEAKKYIDSLN